MSQEQLDAFYEVVVNDASLRMKLESVPDEDFARAAVELGHQHGFGFTVEEFEARLAPPTDGSLSDEVLEQVVGGGTGRYHSRAVSWNASPNGGGTVAFWESVGCFVAGTRIALADGTDAPVESLRPGETVVQRADGTAARSLFGTAGPEKPPVVHVETVDGHAIGVTELHPMVLHDGRVVAAGTLRAEDTLSVVRPDGTIAPATIATIARRRFDGTVYNFEVAGAADEPATHFVIANGLLTGDLHLQRLLEQEASARAA